MNPSIHTPERLDGEAQSSYHWRRAASREAVRLLTTGVERRQPLRQRLRADGKTYEPEADPRGYISGVHKASDHRRALREAVKAMGRRQFLKFAKAQRRRGDWSLT